ncbi:MAG: helix-turn-helix domain-containing protein [Campylobacteraceae bacterium]
MSEKENIVKLTCKELGITQKELAERIGVAEITISQWSRGVNKIPEWAITIFGLLSELKEYKNKDKAIQEAIKLLQTTQK